jgi:hypothetical protein
MFTSVDIQQELIKTKEKHEEAQRSLMQQAQAAIKQGRQVDEYLMKKMRSAPKPGKWGVNPELLDKNRIFSIDDIKAVCIAYRLRFLDTKYYKMEELPYDALIAVKELEQKVGAEIKATKIAAPSGFFKLEDRHKDPMLFARIDETNYYLIHKWGTDVVWYKKLLVYPLRSVYSLFISMVVLGLPLATFLPYVFWHNREDVLYFQRLFLSVVVIYTLFTMVFGGFTFYKRFSKVCWNSPYFN